MVNQPKIEIEPLSEAELPAVIDIENSSFSSPWKPIEFIKNLPDFYIAKLGEKVVGFIGLEQTGDEAHIIHMAVHPSHRRMGIGTALINQAKKINCRKIFLEVRAGNQIAQNLYKKLGFAELPRRKKYYNDNDEDAVIMIYENKTA